MSFVYLINVLIIKLKNLNSLNEGVTAPQGCTRASSLVFTRKWELGSYESYA